MITKSRLLVTMPLLAGLLLLPVFIILPPACKKEDPKIYVVPVLSDLVVSKVTTTSIQGTGQVQTDYDIPITSRGICWNTTGNPTMADKVVSAGQGRGEFAVTLTDLSPSSLYYLRPFAVSDAGTTYGPAMSVHTFSGSVKDVDGNEYSTIVIGKKEWMGENLRTTRLNNGTAILFDDNMNQWSERTTPSYCYNSRSYQYAITYGMLYNGYAALSSMLCPEGWHVPAYQDWLDLKNALGDTATTGSKMKEAGCGHWNQPNTGATNESGFTGLPGGCYRYYVDGGCDNPETWQFRSPGEEAQWWSVSPVLNDTTLYTAYLYNSEPRLLVVFSSKASGLSVRCLKD